MTPFLKRSFLCVLVFGLLLAPSISMFAHEATNGGLGAQVPIGPQEVYSGFVAETLRAMLQQVMVMGLFVVGIGQISHGVHDPNYFRTPTFHKRLVLLSTVMLFVTYTKLTYNVEWGALSPPPEEVFKYARNNFTNSDRLDAALMVVLLTPIDLVIVVLLTGMFLVLARDEFFKRDGTLHRELRQLYLLTGGSHVVTLIWWLGFGLITRGGLSHTQDVWYHLFFAILQGAGYFALTASTNPNHSGSRATRIETIHVCLYSTITVSVYVSRLWIYMFRYTTQGV